LTPEKLRGNFEIMLEFARTEGILYTETGLDAEVTAALADVAGECPDPLPELIVAAQRAFAGQLDGSNAARAQEKLLEIFIRAASDGGDPSPGDQQKCKGDQPV
jgi:hypothetical protein